MFQYVFLRHHVKRSRFHQARCYNNSGMEMVRTASEELLFYIILQVWLALIKHLCILAARCSGCNYELVYICVAERGISRVCDPCGCLIDSDILSDREKRCMKPLKSDIFQHSIVCTGVCVYVGGCILASIFNVFLFAPICGPAFQWLIWIGRSSV